MDTTDRWSVGLWRRPRHAFVDGAVLAALAGLAAVQWRATDGDAAEDAAAVLTVVSSLALVLRHRWGALAVGVSVVAATGATLLAADGVTLLPVAAVVGAVVAGGERREGIVGAAAAVVSLELALLARTGEAGAYPLSAVPLVLALAVAVGLAVDYRRRGARAVLERAVLAEQTRDAEARRAVAEERVRIARELHDVVAHHVAVAGVQAAAAEHLVSVDPDAARAAIAQVRESSASVLQQLSALLDVLRRSADDALAPAPTLDRVDELVDGLRRSGLVVEMTDELADGDRGHDLAPAVDLAAYRLVQEALTNAWKHGDGTARVRLERREGRVVIDVRNPGATSSAGGTGYGLIGMSERAAAVGGTFEAGASDHDFVVHAELPDIRQPHSSGLRAGRAEGEP